MAKRSKDEDEDGHSGQESADDGSPPLAKKPKKSSEKKTEKKPAKSKSATKESSSSSKKGSVAKNVFTNSEGEKFIDLGKKKRATVRSFKGSILIDIREFYGNGDDLSPGKKGISLSPEQWAELKANAGMIDGLVQKLQTS